MPETTLYIKNMVCNRCIMVVEDILRKNGHTPLHTELGKVCLAEKLTEEELGKIRHLLEDVGFELIAVKDNACSNRSNRKSSSSFITRTKN